MQLMVAKQVMHSKQGRCSTLCCDVLLLIVMHLHSLELIHWCLCLRSHDMFTFHRMTNTISSFFKYSLYSLAWPILNLHVQPDQHSNRTCDFMCSSYSLLEYGKSRCGSWFIGQFGIVLRSRGLLPYLRKCDTFPAQHMHSWIHRWLSSKCPQALLTPTHQAKKAFFVSSEIIIHIWFCHVQGVN